MQATSVGFRVLVMLRAGMTFEDFADTAAAFAVACGARDFRVSESARWAWLVSIDVIRRDVFAPARDVPSPLATPRYHACPGGGLAMTVARARTAPALPAAPLSMFDPVYVALDELGQAACLDFADQVGIILAGEPGAGQVRGPGQHRRARRAVLA